MKRSKYFGSWEYEEQYIQKDTKMAGNIQSRQKRSFLTAVAQVLRHLKMNVLVIYKTKSTTHFANKTWQLNPWWNNYSRFYLLSFLYPTNSNKGDISTFLVYESYREKHLAQWLYLKN